MANPLTVITAFRYAISRVVLNPKGISWRQEVRRPRRMRGASPGLKKVGQQRNALYG